MAKKRNFIENQANTSYAKSRSDILALSANQNSVDVDIIHSTCFPHQLQRETKALSLLYLTSAKSSHYAHNI